MTRRKKTEPHPLDIPDFLKISARDRREAWIKHPPRPALILAESQEQQEHRERLAAERRLEQAARRRAQKERKLAMANDRVAQRLKEARVRSMSVADFNRIYRELQVKSRRRLLENSWHRKGDRYYPNVVSGVIEYRPPCASTKQQIKRQAPRAVDEFALAMRRYTEIAALRRLAEKNGVWKDDYAKLPNPGLLRMSIGNRLRAIAKTGQPVVWVG